LQAALLLGQKLVAMKGCANNTDVTLPESH
jgi:hypothetical protein